jgi:DNA polymerase-3 subunit epsilon
MVVSGGGITARPAETLLTERALAYLAAGPSDPVPLIAHICQLSAPPRVVAEHMAVALFAGRPEFARDEQGLWYLAPPERPRIVDAVAERSARYSAVGPRSSPSPVANPVGDPLDSLSYVVVDVETTGGRPWGGDRITEVAAVVVSGGEVREVYETLVNPERSIPPMITALTNISWSMVRDAPLFRDICDEFVDVLAGNVFVAHNAGFDWRFVTSEISRARAHRLEGRRLCTVRLARRLLPHLRSRSLDHVAAYYGVEITARHRAGGDAVATAQVLLRLLDDARDRGYTDWTTLQTLLLTVPKRKRRGRPSAMPRSVDKECGS